MRLLAVVVAICVLVLPAMAQNTNHPYTFLTSTDIDNLRAAVAGSSPAYIASSYGTAKSWADAHISDSLRSYAGNNFTSYYNGQDDSDTMIALAIAYAVTENTAYSDRVRDYVMNFTSWGSAPLPELAWEIPTMYAYDLTALSGSYTGGDATTVWAWISAFASNIASDCTGASSPFENAAMTACGRATLAAMMMGNSSQIDNGRTQFQAQVDYLNYNASHVGATYDWTFRTCDGNAYHEQSFVGMWVPALAAYNLGISGFYEYEATSPTRSLEVSLDWWRTTTNIEDYFPCGAGGDYWTPYYYGNLTNNVTCGNNADGQNMGTYAEGLWESECTDKRYVYEIGYKMYGKQAYLDTLQDETGGKNSRDQLFHYHVARWLPVLMNAPDTTGGTPGGLCASGGAGSALKRAADGLGAGEWCKFDSTTAASDITYNNMTTADMTTNSTCCPTWTWTYTDSWPWCPGTSEGNGFIKFNGSPHNGDGAMITYDESTNDWSQIANWFSCYNGGIGCGTANHGYDQNVMRSSDCRPYYLQQSDPMAFYYYDSSFQQTSGVSGVGNMFGRAVVEFPELSDAGFTGGFVVIEDQTGLYYYDPDTDTWSSNQGGINLTNGQFAAQYNPVHQVVWLMDGHAESTPPVNGLVHYKLSADGTLTQLTSIDGSGDPSSFGVTVNVVAVDGNSGDFIVWDCASGGNWWSYDIIADSWTSISYSMPPLNFINGCSTGNVAESSITDYGVVGYMVSTTGDAAGPFTFYLYKHSDLVTHLYPGADNDFETAAEALVAGETLVVHEGTYTNTNRLSLALAGTSTLPITIISGKEYGYTTEAMPLVTHCGSPCDAATQNTINVENSQYLTIDGLEITSPQGGDGINMNHASNANITIQNCEIHDVEVGIGVQSDATALTIVDNEIYATANTGGTGEGMYLGCHTATCAVTASLVSRNIVRDVNTPTTQGDGIEIKCGSWGNTISHNTVYGTQYPCLTAYGTEGRGANNVWDSNAVWDCGSVESVYMTSDQTFTNNLVISTTSGNDAFNSYSHPNACTGGAGVTPDNMDIRHNTIIGDGVGNCIYARWDGATGITFANNAVYCVNDTYDTDYSGGDWSGVTMAGNVLSPTTTSLPSGFTVGSTIAADFLDSASRNYYPSATSAAVDAGSVTHVTSADFNNDTRDLGTDPDAGIYDYTTAINPGGSTTPGFSSFEGGVCGNSTPDPGEACDDGDQTVETCVYGDTAPYKQVCNATCSAYVDCDNPTYCGDNSVNGSELCDGTDLAGNNCTTIGQSFDGGALACDVACAAWDVSACLNWGFSGVTLKGVDVD